MAKSATLHVSTFQPDLSHPSQSERTRPLAEPCGTAATSQALSDGNNSTAGRKASPTRRDLSQAPWEIYHPPQTTLGLAHERWNLKAAGLPEQVIDTIQSARVSSTHSLYSGK